MLPMQLQLPVINGSGIVNTAIALFQYLWNAYHHQPILVDDKFGPKNYKQEQIKLICFRITECGTFQPELIRLIVHR